MPTVIINKPQEFTVTTAEADLIKNLYTRQLPVQAIKFIREQYGLGLYDAKHICDVIAGRESTPDKNYLKTY